MRTYIRKSIRYCCCCCRKSTEKFFLHLTGFFCFVPFLKIKEVIQFQHLLDSLNLMHTANDDWINIRWNLYVKLYQTCSYNDCNYYYAFWKSDINIWNPKLCISCCATEVTSNSSKKYRIPFPNLFSFSHHIGNAY